MVDVRAESPRRNVFLRVVVTDSEGAGWDLRTDLYAAELRVTPWIWNDRMRKMNRRMSGGEPGRASYAKWLGRYHCREWALEHEGVAPAQVAISRVTYRIPTPETTRANGPYVAEELMVRTSSEKKLHTTKCDRDPEAQLPNSIRARHGLPELEGERVRWNRLVTHEKRWIKKHGGKDPMKVEASR
jgi:hypothetical protein